MKFQLILLEDTAIEIRFRHASLKGVYGAFGGRLSNTWVICPWDWLIPGNWG